MVNVSIAARTNVSRRSMSVAPASLGYPKRQAQEIPIDGLPDNAPELVLARALFKLRDMRDEQLTDAPRFAQNATMLVLSHRKQRLLSSIEAFAHTMRVHCQALECAGAKQSPPPLPLTSECSCRSSQTTLPSPHDDRARYPGSDAVVRSRAQPMLAGASPDRTVSRRVEADRTHCGSIRNSRAPRSSARSRAGRMTAAWPGRRGSAVPTTPTIASSTAVSTATLAGQPCGLTACAVRATDERRRRLTHIRSQITVFVDAAAQRSRITAALYVGRDVMVRLGSPASACVACPVALLQGGASQRQRQPSIHLPTARVTPHM